MIVAMKNLLVVVSFFLLLLIGWNVNDYFTNEKITELKTQIGILKDNLVKSQKVNLNLESKIAIYKSSNLIIQQISDIRQMKENIDEKIIDCSTKGYCDSSSGFSISVKKSENIDLALVGFNKQSNDYQKQIETLLSKIN